MELSAVIIDQKNTQGFLQIGDKKVIEIIYDKLCKLFKDVIIISNQKEKIKDLLGFVRVYQDDYEIKGPLSGIFSGLSNIKNRKAFICSSNMPFIEINLIKHLVEAIEDWDIICPIKDKKIEPLCAIYDKKCLAYIQKIFNSDNNKNIITLLTRVSTNYLNINELPDINPNSFIKINNGEDFQKFKDYIID